VTAPLVLTADVVGVTFVDGYPENLYRLEELERERRRGEPLTVLLLREPLNQHDENAVAVHVPAVGIVGHLARELAAQVAPLLDAGARVLADLYVRIHPEHPEKPGLTVLAVLTADHLNPDQQEKTP
jgi:hypothetical protein